MPIDPPCSLCMWSSRYRRVWWRKKKTESKVPCQRAKRGRRKNRRPKSLHDKLVSLPAEFGAGLCGGEHYSVSADEKEGVRSLQGVRKHSFCRKTGHLGLSCSSEVAEACLTGRLVTAVGIIMSILPMRKWKQRNVKWTFSMCKFVLRQNGFRAGIVNHCAASEIKVVFIIKKQS